VAALRAPRAGKTVGEDAAFQIAAELSFHVLRHTVPAGVPVAGERQVGLEVPLDRLVQRGALGAAPAIHSARGRRVDGSVHASTAAYAYGPTRLLDISTVMRGTLRD